MTDNLRKKKKKKKNLNQVTHKTPKKNFKKKID